MLSQKLGLIYLTGSKLISIDLYHHQEQWNQYRPEDQPNKPKHINPNDHSEHGNQRMDVHQFFRQPKPKNIIGTADNTKAESEHYYSPHIVAVGKQ